MSMPAERKRPVRSSPRAGAGRAGARIDAGIDAGIDAPERFGQYLLYERLGQGAMASVRRGVLCRDAGFRRMVALKQLHPHLAKIPEMVELFAHEARLGSYLRHANLAQTFDFGSVNGTYFIAMELVRGPTLAQLARQCAGAAGPIPMGIVLGILTQLCDAFDYIRDARDPLGQPLHLAHCDVSPTNIIISSTGYVKLIDFGIARAGSSRPLVETGVLRRRLAYVAPEYAEGKLDARSDLFSLGVIGYELIANQPLFAGSGDELRRVREMPIPPLVRSGPVPHVLQDVIMTALQRDPARRWQTAAEMRSALSDVARGMAVHIGPPQVAGWITWAFSQRLRPDAMTPLVVGAAAARSSGSPAARAAMTTASIKATGKPAGKPAGRPSVRLPSSTAFTRTAFTRELTRQFLRAALRHRPPTGAVGIEPLRRKLAHTVPRGLRKANRLRIAPTASVDRPGLERQLPAAAPDVAIQVASRPVAAPVAPIQVASRPVAAPVAPIHVASEVAPRPPAQALPPVALPEPSPSVSPGRADAAPRTSEAMRPAATLPTPGLQRDRGARPTPPPREPVAQAAGVARSTPDTTGIVVVPASRRPGKAAGPERAHRTRMVRFRRRLPRPALAAVFALLAAIVAFAFMYRWLHH